MGGVVVIHLEDLQVGHRAAAQDLGEFRQARVAELVPVEVEHLEVRQRPHLLRLGLGLRARAGVRVRARVGVGVRVRQRPHRVGQGGRHHGGGEAGQAVTWLG